MEKFYVLGFVVEERIVAYLQSVDGKHRWVREVQGATHFHKSSIDNPPTANMPGVEVCVVEQRIVTSVMTEERYAQRAKWRERRRERQSERRQAD